MMELRTKLIVILAAPGCGADTKNTAGRSFQKQASHQQSQSQRTITGFQRLWCVSFSSEIDLNWSLANHRDVLSRGWWWIWGEDRPILQWEHSVQRLAGVSARQVPAALHHRPPRVKPSGESLCFVISTSVLILYCYNNIAVITCCPVFLDQAAPDAQIITDECSNQLNWVLTSTEDEEIMGIFSLLTLQSRLLQVFAVGFMTEYNKSQLGPLQFLE